jgi:O-antigen/teichoic acid export membrane protein
MIDVAVSGAGARVLKGTGSSALRQLTGAIEALVLVPLFLHAWGPETYGRWLAVAALASYFSLLDLGAQSYIGNLLAMERARGNTAAVRRILSEATSLFVLVGAAGLVLVALMVSGVLPPLGHGLDVRGADALVFALLAVNGLIALQGGIYGTVYQASGRYARGLMLGNVARLVTIVIAAPALYVGLTPPLYAVLVLGPGVLLTVTLVLDSRHWSEDCRHIRLSVAHARAALRHLPGAFHFWLMGFAQTMKLQGMVLVVAATGDMRLVTLYVTHRSVASLAGYTTMLLQGPLWPELSALAARGSRAVLEQISLLVIKLSVVATGVTALVLFIVTPALYPLWTGRRFELDPWLFAFLLVQAVLAAGWSTSVWGPLAANRHQVVTYCMFANAIVSVVAAKLLLPVFGAAGIGMAALAADVVFGLVLLPKLASSVIGISAVRIYGAIATASGLVVLLLVPAAIASHLFEWWEAMAVFLVIVGVAAYPIAHLLLGRDTTQGLIAWARPAARSAR